MSKDIISKKIENFTLITKFYVMLFPGGVIMQRILVVEDDLDIQELLKNFLQEVGYETILASDGVEALSTFLPHGLIWCCLM